MDIKRKKELLKEWKNRRPEMGIISISCKPTGDLFLGISKDTSAEFEYSVVEVLKYENPEDDQTDKLLELLECCIIEMPNARRI